MEKFKNFFKSRKEVEKYFGSEVFKFEYMIENTIGFKILNPKFIDDELMNITLEFYYNDTSNFYAYSSFKDWLSFFQIERIICESEETHLRETMYFEEYKDEEELTH